jgi:hypothetical protein
MTCDYCADRGHNILSCPHLAAHLVNPSPQFTGLRKFVGAIDRSLDDHGRETLSGAVCAKAAGHD